MEVYYDGARIEPRWTMLDSAYMAEPKMQTYYPMIHVIPGPKRKVLSVGRNLTTSNQMHLLDLDVPAPKWISTSQSASFRAVNATMYTTDKILRSVIPNGPNQPIPSQNIVTLQNGDVTTVTPAQALETGRIEFNSVILPDGNVLMIGGGTRPIGAVPGELQHRSEAIFKTELYKPAAGAAPEERCTVAWMRHRDPDGSGPGIGTPRMYHSTALLLPDGKIIVAGRDVEDGCPNPPGINPLEQHCISADYYKPPYLFQATGQPIESQHRPTFANVPSHVAPGEQFLVDVTSFGQGATSISNVSLVRPGATTHAIDMDQRRLPLGFDPLPGQLRITAPADLNQAPPGYYMLFAMNDGDNGGHPSVGQFVQFWGIHAATMQAQVTQTCGSGSSSLVFAMSWETTIATTGTDSLLLYNPAGTCGTLPALVYTAPAPASSTLRTITTQSLPCISGTWRYQVRSSIGNSKARSVCKAIQVACASCCNPPCELE